jgi:hypothetical protein
MPVVYRRCRFDRNRGKKENPWACCEHAQFCFYYSLLLLCRGILFWTFDLYLCVSLICYFLVVVGPKQPRKILLEQLVRCMPADDALPDHVVMVSGADLQGCNLAGRLAERQQRAVCTGGVADVRATIACLVSKIQKL